jgi:hypothetical protein
MAEQKTSKLSLSGADPKFPFYITGDLWPDGSVEICNEGKDSLSLEAAIELATDTVTEHGGTMYVVECRVVRKVTRRSVKVETIKTKSIRPEIAKAGAA